MAGTRWALFKKASMATQLVYSRMLRPGEVASSLPPPSCPINYYVPRSLRCGHTLGHTVQTPIHSRRVFKSLFTRSHAGNMRKNG